MFKPVISKTEKKTKHRNSFCVRTLYDWNRLSDDIVTCDSLETFKSLLTNLDYIAPPSRVVLKPVLVSATYQHRNRNCGSVFRVCLSYRLILLKLIILHPDI